MFVYSHLPFVDCRISSGNPVMTDQNSVTPPLATVEEDRPAFRSMDSMTTLTELRRESLPQTRRSRTHKFAISGHEGYLTIGLFQDGQPGEIFIKMSKEGSTLSGLIQGFCRAFSLALQHGLSAADAVERFRGMRFEPMGPTSNPEIPEASSILDYVARYIEKNFVAGTD